MFIEMKVSGLTIDPITGTPIVILKDVPEKKAIPIWIGLFEASAIATELEKVKFSRPMTHDLLKDILGTLQVTLVRVEIQDLRNNTFFASIFLERDGQDYVVDARPSDAIALALRVGSPIFVEEKVIEKSRSVDFEVNLMEKDKLTDDKLKEFLENLPIENFGKYKM
ncbi:MAG TPA: bifunctional nuclease family protein [Syntrophales bacterium]|nr:bifunctional nuclease family protein [Syntrophales bacterium]HPX55397.1 bifunctional nuclease family protein [Syntrophales bacterium]HQA82677.1 bifunctional nuclease family protein [Syntrophales bacterium]